MPEIIYQADVIWVLRALDASLAAGLDDLHGTLLMCCPYAADVLCSGALISCFFVFEKALVIPLFKNGSR